MNDDKRAQRWIWQLPRQYIDEMARLGTLRSVPARTVLITEGEVGDSLFIVLTGRVRAFLADDLGREFYLNEHGPGEHFGEMMLDDGARSASVITIEPSRFAVLSRAQVQEYLLTHPEAAMAMIRMLIGRVRVLTRTVGNLTLLDVYGRVARLLLDSTERQADGRLALPGRPTQQDIASRVGASREMVSRILRDLREGGYIDIEDHRIYVLREPPEEWQ